MNDETSELCGSQTVVWDAMEGENDQPLGNTVPSVTVFERPVEMMEALFSIVHVV